MSSCHTCRADWSASKFSPDCAECAGGAMTKPCPMCQGACGAQWWRAVLDSHDYGLGCFVGTCVKGQDKIEAPQEVRDGLSRYLSGKLPSSFLFFAKSQFDRSTAWNDVRATIKKGDDNRIWRKCHTKNYWVWYANDGDEWYAGCNSPET